MESQQEEGGGQGPSSLSQPVTPGGCPSRFSRRRCRRCPCWIMPCPRGLCRLGMRSGIRRSGRCPDAPRPPSSGAPRSGPFPLAPPPNRPPSQTSTSRYLLDSQLPTAPRDASCFPGGVTKLLPFSQILCPKPVHIRATMQQRYPTPYGERMSPNQLCNVPVSSFPSSLFLWGLMSSPSKTSQYSCGSSLLHGAWPSWGLSRPPVMVCDRGPSCHLFPQNSSLLGHPFPHSVSPVLTHLQRAQLLGGAQVKPLPVLYPTFPSAWLQDLALHCSCWLSQILFPPG